MGEVESAAREQRERFRAALADLQPGDQVTWQGAERKDGTGYVHDVGKFAPEGRVWVVQHGTTFFTIPLGAIVHILKAEKRCPACRAPYGEAHKLSCSVGGAKVASVPVELPAPADEHAARKGRPLARGVLDYFPDALQAVAELSRVGNEQHNAGQPMHWAYGKSSDHADCILRHLIDRGVVDSDGVSHTVKVAWRALALLQTELEAADAELHARREAMRAQAAKGERT